MGTDLELLERAARAAGITLRAASVPGSPAYLINVATESRWDPLTDDGDALRLAVQLRLDVLSGVGCVEVCHCPGTLDDPFGETLAVEYGADLFAATRRAIVRAAAAMPEGGQG